MVRTTEAQNFENFLKKQAHEFLSASLMQTLEKRVLLDADLGAVLAETNSGCQTNNDDVTPPDANPTENNSNDDNEDNSSGPDLILNKSDQLGGCSGHSLFNDTNVITIAEDFTATITFMGEEAGYKNTLGMYKLDAEGNVLEVKILFANASSQGSGGDLIDGQSSVEVELEACDHVGFFIVSNAFSKGADNRALLQDTNGTFQLQNSDGDIGNVLTDSSLKLVHIDGDTNQETVIKSQYGTDIYHSVGKADNSYAPNPDNFRHAFINLDSQNGDVGINFEDLRNGGDKDYDDVMIKFHIGQHNVEQLTSDADNNIDFIGQQTDGPVQPGDIISYSLSYNNSGTETATNVVITENLPEHTSFNADESTSGWVDNGDGTFSFTIDEVDVGEAGEVIFAVTVNDTIPAGVEEIFNTACIDDDGTHGADINQENNCGDENTEVEANPDLVITKSDNDVDVFPGETIEYVISFENVGNQGASNVIITEYLPTHTSFNANLSSIGWQNNGNGQFTFNLNTVEAGESGEIIFAVTVDGSIDETVEEIDNTVSINDDGTNGEDPTSENNSDDEKTPVKRPVISSTPPSFQSNSFVTLDQPIAQPSEPAVKETRSFGFHGRIISLENQNDANLVGGRFEGTFDSNFGNWGEYYFPSFGKQAESITKTKIGFEVDQVNWIGANSDIISFFDDAFEKEEEDQNVVSEEVENVNASYENTEEERSAE